MITHSNVFEYNNRIIGLDLIRCTAILWVVAYHGTLLIPIEFREMYNLLFFIDGVSIFFVLSGFLIGNILIKYLKTNIFRLNDLFNFWKRRWIRTLPNYFLILIILIILDFKNWNYNFSYALFLQNFASPIPTFFVVSWSLSVEEWFYFLFPFTLYISYNIIGPNDKNIKHVVMFIAIIFIIITSLLRYMKMSHGGVEFSEEIRKVVIYRLDSIVWGIIGALFYNYYQTAWQKLKHPLLLISIILLIFLILLHILNVSGIKILTNKGVLFESIFSFTIEALVVLFSIPFLSDLKTFNSKLLNKIVSFISKISYSLYLVHASLVLWLIIPKIDLLLESYNISFHYNRLILNTIYWGLSLSLSFMLFRYFETPILKLRDRITKKE